MAIPNQRVIRQATEEDLSRLLELEALCWNPALRVSEDALRARLIGFPSGQFVVESAGEVWAAIYSQRIADIGKLSGVRFDNAFSLHRGDGPFAQVLSLNVYPHRQDLDYGDALLEHLLDECERIGVAVVVGVTRCKDRKKHPVIPLADYIQLKNAEGRHVDTVLRMHQFHGAEIVSPMPGYRPADTENDGHGVLVRYDLPGRQQRLRALQDARQAATVPLPCPVVDVEPELLRIAGEVLGASRLGAERPLRPQSPLFELGFESADLLDLRDRIESRFGLRLTPLFFFEHNTLEKVASFIQAPRAAAVELPSTAPEAAPEFNAAADGDIAIIGMACRFPGGLEDPQAFWQALRDGCLLVGTLPPGRWVWPEGIDPRSTHPGIDRGGFVARIDEFDADLFRVAPSEAQRMDPQQRWLLELGWACLEDAGHAPGTMASRPVGVFVGASGSDYQRLMDAAQVPVQAHSGLATSMAVLANRLSYFFDLQGPSVQIDTACSSSLVALHSAVRALRAGDCEAALVGGVNVMCHPAGTLAYYQAGMLSREGLCKTFDASANGYVRAEGAVVLLLKKLSHALADGDRIHAVVKGVAVNHGGTSGGLTVPNAARQSALVRQALADGGVAPASVSYIEAHGTGTSLGDPIEVRALADVFRDSCTPCGLGSVKTNIGHLEAAAGVAGVLKAVLCLQHQTLVPSLHFSRLNPNIQLEGSPFYMVDTLKPWPAPDCLPRRAGVSSFGSGGTNAHVLLEAFAAGAPAAAACYRERPCIVVLSAATEDQLAQQARRLLDHIERHALVDADLADMAFTLQMGREPMRERWAVVASTMEVVREVLGALATRAVVQAPAVRARTKPLAREARRRQNEEVAHQLEAWVAQGCFDLVAQAWVEGTAVDWSRLYPVVPRPRRIGLPTYAFARNRHWVDQPGRPAAASVQGAAPDAALHALLHANTSDLQGLRFSTWLSGREFFLDDHRVNGSRVLPAVAYLEMAREAVTRSMPTGDEGSAIELRHLAWAQPVVVASEPRAVHIALRLRAGGETAFEIFTDSAESGGKTVHCVGAAVRVRRPTITDVDLPAVQARTDVALLEADACYRAFESVGLAYGPAHRPLQQVRVGTGELLATIALPAFLRAGAAEYVIHPSLLDGVLQAVMCAAVQDGPLRTALPFSLESIVVLGRCPEVNRAWIRRASHRRSQAWDIDLCDERGRVCMRLQGYSARELPASATGSAPGRETNRPCLFKPVWQHQPAPARAQPQGFAWHLALCVPGLDGAELRRVAPSMQLMLAQDAPQGLADAFEARTLKLFEQVKQILAARPCAPVLLQVVVPAWGPQRLHAALSGLLKTAHLENPLFVGQLIAVGAQETAQSLLRKLQENAACPEDMLVSYDGEHRCVRRMVPLHPAPAGGTADPWREDGVYLLTGGAGGLGLLFAREIRRRAPRATLVLAGRSEPSAEIAAALDSLREAGGAAAYRQLDVADAQAVASLLAEVVHAHGALHGIVHAAGVIEDDFILRKNADSVRRVLRPKVAGLLHLDEASKHLPLDFFLVFSSILGWTGNPGQADYAVGNAFLDAFVDYRQELVAAGARWGLSLSIGWPLWRDGGMQVDAATLKTFKTRLGLVPMDSGDGLAAFYDSLASGENHVVVATGDHDLLVRSLDVANIWPATASPAAPPASPSAVPAQTWRAPLLDWLKRMFSRTTQRPVEDIDEDEQLGSYGLDSIYATELTLELEDSFGVLPKTLLFEYHTLNELAQYFIASHAPALRRLFSDAHAASAPPPPAAEPTPPSRQAIDEQVATDRVLRPPLLALLKRMFSQVSQRAVEAIDEDELLGSYGLDSIYATELTMELEDDFGSLPKTLFFEYHTLSELAAYFLAQHRGTVERLFPAASAQPACTPVAADDAGDLRPQPACAAAATATPARASFADAPSAAPAPAGGPLDIAVIGLSGRYPQAESLQAFWRNLREGRDCIEEVPSSRWDWRVFYTGDREQPGRHHSKWGGFVSDADCFDALFFNISPYEADYLEPQERLFLEQAWGAVEDAGYTRQSLHGAAHDPLAGQVGVYAGLCYGQYQLLFNPVDGINGNSHVITSTFGSVANRVSAVLNLHGPSLSVDTLCSSSLVAIHLACQDLRHGVTRMALAGGVNLSVHPNKYAGLSAAGFLSSKGRCESFGAGGDGYVPAEGVGVVVLKRLADAVRDGDHVYGVIKGSAITHGGRVNGYTVPNPKAQKDAIVRALAQAGIAPEAVSYVEAHGTGTSLGDPIEVAALSEAFGAQVRRQSCAIGSVKSNIGHCEAAAGVCGLSKVLLQLQHGELVPSLHAEQLNPNIDFTATPFAVNRGLRPWTRPQVDGAPVPRTAGVSSFGATGTNVHLVVQEYDERPTRPHARLGRPAVVVLSARDPQRLLAYAQRLSDHLAADGGQGRIDLHDLAFTLQTGREAMEDRLAIVASSVAQLQERLHRHLAQDAGVPGVHTGRAVRPGRQASAAGRSDGSSGVPVGPQADADALARTWAGGHTVDWLAWYGDHTPRRVSAPSYPFARERHWVPEKERGEGMRHSSKEVLHPLPNENTSDRFATATSPAASSPPAAGEVSETWLTTPRWDAVPLPADLPTPDRQVRVLLAGANAAQQETIRLIHPAVTTLDAPADADIGELAGRLPPPGSFDHIVWVAPNDAAAPGVQPLLRLFRLVKAMLLAGHDKQALSWTVVTTAGQAVMPADIPQAAQAALAAFVGCVAKECGFWRLRTCDLQPGLPWSPADMRRLPFDADGPTWACRDGEWFVQKLVPVQPVAPHSGTPAYRQGGVYLVIGGAGGIGSVWSRWVAERHDARLVWVGRRERAQVQAQLDACSVHGLQPEYLQADASDAAALERVRQQAKACFGRIDGVVVSALDLFDKSLAQVDEAHFRAVLSVNVDVTLAVDQVFGAEPLDFLLFFSSVEAFSRSAGYSGYAAGCAFKDAVALQAAARGRRAARVLNWGYWRVGSGERVGPHVKSRYQRIGIEAIEAEQGMALLQSLLEGPFRQLAVARLAHAQALPAIEPARRITCASQAPAPWALRGLPLAWPGRVAELQAEAPQAARFEDLCAEVLLACLQEAGLFEGGAIDPTQLAQRLPATPQYTRWLRESLAWLQRHGRLAKQGGQLCLEGTVGTASDAWQAWARSAEVWRANPGLRAKATLAEACLRALPDILAGRRPATEVMFPRSSMTLVEGVYQGNPVADFFNQCLVRTLVACIADGLARAPQRPVRILEIGAGTGGTTAAVLPALQPYREHIGEYCYTDVSKAFLFHAQEHFAPQYGFVRTALFDVEKPLAGQGIGVQAYDFVIATNVLHATRNIRWALRHAKACLRPGGVLLLNELSDKSLFAHVTFGLLPGWWLNQDEGPLQRRACACTGPAGRRVLQRWHRVAAGGRCRPVPDVGERRAAGRPARRRRACGGAAGAERGGRDRRRAGQPARAPARRGAAAQPGASAPAQADRPGPAHGAAAAGHGPALEQLRPGLDPHRPAQRAAARRLRARRQRAAVRVADGRCADGPLPARAPRAAAAHARHGRPGPGRTRACDRLAVGRAEAARPQSAHRQRPPGGGPAVRPGTDRHHRHERALSAGARPGRVLGEPALGPRLRRRSAAGPLAAGRLLPSRQGRSRGPRHELQQVGRLSRRACRVRPAVLQHLATRGASHGSAGAPAAGVLLGASGGRGLYPRAHRVAAWRPGGRVHRRHAHRLRAVRARSVACRANAAAAHVVRLDGQPPLVRAELHRPEHRGGHDVLVLADGGARGLRAPAVGRLRHGRRRRRQRLRAPVELCAVLRASHVVRRGPLQELRRGRRWLRARRGRRPGAAEAPVACAGRRRPDPRAGPRHQRQPRRQDKRLHRAQPSGAGGGGAQGARCRRAERAPDQLHRGARHRYGVGRPGGDPRPHAGLRTRNGRHRLLRHRLGEVQHRPPRGRRGHRRPGQAGAADEAPPAGADAACRSTQPEHRFRAHALRAEPGLAGVGTARHRRKGSDQDGRRVFVRGRWLQCPCDSRGVRACGCTPRAPARRRRRHAGSLAAKQRRRGSRAVCHPCRSAASLCAQAARRAAVAVRHRPQRAGVHAAGGPRGDGRAARPAGALRRRAEVRLAALPGRGHLRRAAVRGAGEAAQGDARRVCRRRGPAAGNGPMDGARQAFHAAGPVGQGHAGGLAGAVRRRAARAGVGADLSLRPPASLVPPRRRFAARRGSGRGAERRAGRAASAAARQHLHLRVAAVQRLLRRRGVLPEGAPGAWRARAAGRRPPRDGLPGAGALAGPAVGRGLPPAAGECGVAAPDRGGATAAGPSGRPPARRRRVRVPHLQRLGRSAGRSGAAQPGHGPAGGHRCAGRGAFAGRAARAAGPRGRCGRGLLRVLPLGERLPRSRLPGAAAGVGRRRQRVAGPVGAARPGARHRGRVRAASQPDGLRAAGSAVPRHRPGPQARAAVRHGAGGGAGRLHRHDVGLGAAFAADGRRSHRPAATLRRRPVRRAGPASRAPERLLLARARRAGEGRRAARPGADPRPLAGDCRGRRHQHCRQRGAPRAGVRLRPGPRSGRAGPAASRSASVPRPSALRCDAP
ncbi:MAG: SDR family NAD(P)-dependent oxidoreductase [Burkholderiales bacterium]|nr:SDR family NAD(P)-dependent oxidoreductase [Burkholderiales bacterium]